MRRFPWVSVALLIDLGLLAALTYPAWGDHSAGTRQGFETVYVILGWACVGLALVIGALGVWARAPATLPTALGIVGAGAFAGAWLVQFMEQDDPSGLNLGMVVAFTGALVAFAASARRPAFPAEP
jgi:uncharacterized membrane protein YeaQ/YmgE (transglycosylase-associated protein family)